MSSTNKTSNYELSQFLGTDKPAWLADYNSDMGKIDAQMKLNADGVTTASGAASSAAAAVGTLANLTTDAKTSAVAAINEVDGHADTAQSTASSALSAATGAGNTLTALKSYLTLNNITTYNTSSQFAVTAGGGSIYGGEITVERNTDGSMCEVFGNITITGANASGNAVVKLNVDTGLRPDDTMVVKASGVGQGDLGANGGTILSNLELTINTDGTLEFKVYHPSGTTVYIRAFNGLIIVKDFSEE